MRAEGIDATGGGENRAAASSAQSGGVGLALRSRAVRWIRRRGKGSFAGALVATACWVIAGGGYDYRPLDASSSTPRPPTSSGELSAALARLAPRGNYIVIDRANNRLYLRRGEAVLLEAVCSSGSGTVLRASDGSRTWVFDTPEGVFGIQAMTRNPLWRRPDWAFVEEGRPLPATAEDRMESGTLGAYALHIGNGYLIHGTLYERLLGRSVTHGCIRLGRDDLRRVYEASSLGTAVYIF